MILFPCGLCGKEVHNTNKEIACDNCSRWIHLKCNEVNDLDFNYSPKKE